MSRGCVYLRGGTWWIKFYRDGLAVRESSHSHERWAAEQLLAERLRRPYHEHFACPNCGAAMTRLQRMA